MVDLVDEGKVGRIGVSNFEVDVVERCESVRHVDTDQREMNLVNLLAAEAVIPWCAAHGTGVLTYSPMASGLLTGRVSPQRVRSLPDDDWRGGAPEFQEPRLSRNPALVERLGVVADRLGCSLPELAVAWVLAWPGVTAAHAVEETGAGSGPVRPGEGEA